MIKLRYFISIFFIFLAVLVLLNIGLQFFYTRHDRSLSKENQVSRRYGQEMVGNAYPHRGAGEIDTLLNETWGRKMAFESFVDFVEKPRKGHYVNVGTDGFRHNGMANPWPITSENFNIFFFGGSTTFGYGVADDETVPHYLQELLNQNIGNSDSARKVAVYNFGAGYHYSVQERTRLAQLILEGHIPDLAIFMDGVNDLYLTEPEFAPAMRQGFGQDNSQRFLQWWNRLPMQRLAASLRHRLLGGGVQGFPVPDLDSVEWPRKALARYQSNLRLANAELKAFDVPGLHVWQPSHFLHFSDGELPFLQGSDDMPFMRNGYRMVEKLASDSVFIGKDFLWLGDVRPAQPPYFVDHVHYSAQYHQLLASHIAKALEVRGTYP